ncbi:esterase YqiA [Marinomonas aquimarina]|uniref:Esterase YqiA n=1 Tax=Marinomonas aquimarina TaxID=295068 RepID=A0A1A8T233_9GAMM|nr:YqiA/YcfP family alpha/beta fold hydrolase [Marinomonas aquimarina]SBS25329.1 esterase YqiA [Marinomonas aquimarina]
MPHIIYVHGFNSSEFSYKSQLVKRRLEALGQPEQFSCPRLPWQPLKAIALLEQKIEQLLSLNESVALVGSSLGGFYSAYLSAKYDLKAVLVNPAVEAPSLLRDYLGTQINPYTQEQYELAEEHMLELESLDLPACDANNLWLMLQQEDEVLNYRAALERFPTVARLICEPGGDHSFVGFDRFIDQILHFVGFQDDF